MCYNTILNWSYQPSQWGEITQVELRSHEFPPQEWSQHGIRFDGLLARCWRRHVGPRRDPETFHALGVVWRRRTTTSTEIPPWRDPPTSACFDGKEWSHSSAWLVTMVTMVTMVTFENSFLSSSWSQAKCYYAYPRFLERDSPKGSFHFRCCRCLICHRYPLALLIKFIGESLHPATASLNIQDPTCCDKHIRSGSLCGPSSAYGAPAPWKGAGQCSPGVVQDWGNWLAMGVWARRLGSFPVKIISEGISSSSPANPPVMARCLGHHPQFWDPPTWLTLSSFSFSWSLTAGGSCKIGILLESIIKNADLMEKFRSLQEFTKTHWDLIS